MIYVDNAATTKLADEVLDKMLPFLKEQYGNASTQYSLGVTARRAVSKAREQFAIAINAQPSEIYFTSGGSESDNWAISGIAYALKDKGNHIITSAIEHHAVLNACAALEKQGFKISYIPVDKYGRVSPEDVCSAIRPETTLISIMLANNEIGTIQPITEISKIAKSHGIILHTDAVQAVGHIPVDVNALDINLLSASAHKFNGPKGIGILYKKTGTPLLPLIYGGHQEFDQRAGTENVAGIVGAGAAIEVSLTTLQESILQTTTLSNMLIKEIKSKIPKVITNGHSTQRLPGIVSISFTGYDSESIMNILDIKGICVSNGSACNSGTKSLSHVLLATGTSEANAIGTIRISFGKYNTVDEVEKIVNALTFVINRTCSE